MSDTVRCKGCQRDLTPDDFHKRYRGGRVTLQARCKACQRAYGDRQRDENRASGVFPTTPITCRRCGVTKPVDDFNRTTTNRTGRCAECRACQAARNRDRYTNNERRLYVMQYLLEHPCVDCGETDFRILTFDHVRGEKVFHLSAVAHVSRTRAQIDAEIAKCEVRCANCHLRVTGERAGWYRDLTITDGRLEVVESPRAVQKPHHAQQMALDLAPKLVRHPNAKIDAETVYAIRVRYRDSEATMQELAAEFGTSFGAVHGLLVGRSWRHIGGPLLGRDYTRGGDCERCSVPGCAGPYLSNGLCSAHYSVARRVRAAGGGSDDDQRIASYWRARVKKGRKPGRRSAA